MKKDSWLLQQLKGRKLATTGEDAHKARLDAYLALRLDGSDEPTSEQVKAKVKEVTSP